MGEFEGKVAVLTGGGGGIGRQIALDLARRGAAVVVNDVGGSTQGDGSGAGAAQRVVDEIVAAGGRAIADGGTVTDPAAADHLIARAIEEFGKLDILVNFAGILRDRMIFKMSDEEWESCLRVHLYGHFHTCRAACRHFRERSKSVGGPADGRIIVVTSEAGIYGNVGQSNYASAKAGVVGLTLTMAREMGQYGVTANAVAPRALTPTLITVVGEEAAAELKAIADAEGFDRWDPAHVAPLIAFLGGERGGSYTGQLFVVGGGVLQILNEPSVRAELEVRQPLDVDDVDAFVRETIGESATVVAFPDMGLDNIGAHH